MPRTNIAIFASTRGTSSQGLIEAIEKNDLPNVEIKFFLSNKEDCEALERARKYNIKDIFVDPEGKTREQFDTECMEYLEKEQVDLVVLIGYMRILSKPFVEKWGNKCMNIHPSLLPAFAGGMDKDVHAEVLKAGVKKTGCTLHFIAEVADAGPIILQKEVEITENETVDSLKEKVQEKEKEASVEGVKLFSEGKMRVEEDEVVTN